MLGFMGGITSELEQKHLDLTSGLAAFTTNQPLPSLVTDIARTASDEGQLVSERRSPLSPDGSASLVDGVSIGSASDAATTRGSWSDPGSTTYEEQLLQHFLVIDPPAAIFGPVSMEWKYVRPSMLAHARDYGPLLNALYCYSDIHTARMEGKRWRWAPTYYRVASSEIQTCLLGDVTDTMLVNVFATVFLLMLSEVCVLTLEMRMSDSPGKRRFSHHQSFALQVHRISIQPIFYFNDSVTALKLGLD